MRLVKYLTILLLVFSVVGTFAGTRDTIKPIARLLVVEYGSGGGDNLYNFCAAIPCGIFHDSGTVYQAPVLTDDNSSDTIEWFNDSFKGYLEGHGDLQLLTTVGNVDSSVIDTIKTNYGITDSHIVQNNYANPVINSGWLSKEWTSSPDAVFCYYTPSPGDNEVQSVVNAASLASALNCPLFFIGSGGLDVTISERLTDLSVTNAYYVSIGDEIPAAAKTEIAGMGIATAQNLTTETEIATYLTSRIDEAVICFYDPDDNGQAMAAVIAAAAHEGFAAPIPSSFITKGLIAGELNDLYGIHQFEKLPEPLPFVKGKAGETALANDFKNYIASVGAFKNDALEVVYTFDKKAGGHLDVAFDRAILGDPEEPNEDGAIAGRYVNDGELNIPYVNYTTMYKALIYDNPRPGHVTFMGEAYEAGYNTSGYAGSFTDNDNSTHIVNEVIRWDGEDACAAEDWKDNNYEVHGHNSPNAGSGSHPWNPAGVDNIGFIADITAGSGFYYNSCHGSSTSISPASSDDGIADDDDPNSQWGEPHWPADDQRVNKSGGSYTNNDFDDDYDNYNGMIGIFNSCDNGAGNLGQVWTRHLGAACIASYTSVSFDGSGRFWCLYIDAIADDQLTMGEGIGIANAHTSQVFPQNESAGDSSLRYYLTGDPLMKYYHPTWTEPTVHPISTPVGGHDIEEATDISILYFDVNPRNDKIIVKWDAVSDGELKGFNIYRNEIRDTKKTATDNAKFVNETGTKLNGSLITGEGPYNFVDDSVKSDTAYAYILEAIEYSGTALRYGPASASTTNLTKRIFALNQNYPNPIESNTTFAFALPTTADVTLDIYDISGRKVRTVVSGTYEAGEHRIQWDSADDAGNKLVRGVYMYRLASGDNVSVKKLVIK